MGTPDVCPVAVSVMPAALRLAALLVAVAVVLFFVLLAYLRLAAPDKSKPAPGSSQGAVPAAILQPISTSHYGAADPGTEPRARTAEHDGNKRE